MTDAIEIQKKKPRNFRFVHVRMSLKLLDEVKKAADAEGKTVSVFIRETVRSKVSVE
jgi:hypothetical protein